MNQPLSTLLATDRSAAEQPLTDALITEIQSRGVRLVDMDVGAPSRRGGAGPSDHKAVIIDGHTLMVPVHTHTAAASPFLISAVQLDASGQPNGAELLRDGVAVGRVAFPQAPNFYQRKTSDGIAYGKIAQLHGTDVLATTVLQTCVRYGRRSTSCQFCAIGESLKNGLTINRKLPQHLAEVARAAVELDGVKHMVMTTGTPNFTDRGAAILCESAAAVKAVVDLPIQAQCEPPDDPAWFQRLKDAGVDSLGMHLEAVTPAVRARIMPGKAEVTLDQYMTAFADAVAVFGRGQVSTYILAGLGDSVAAMLAMCEKLIALGVYPFVVPFVPNSDTPLANHPAPSAEFMRSILQPLGAMLSTGNLRSRDIKAGCGRCGACSTLSTYE
jgi:radical SAM protein (TIGR04043 family)